MLLFHAAKLLLTYSDLSIGFKECEVFKKRFTIATASPVEFSWLSGNLNPGLLSSSATFYLPQHSGSPMGLHFFCKYFLSLALHLGNGFHYEKVFNLNSEEDVTK